MTPSTPTGYRKRPWELTVLAVFFALVPVLSLTTRYVSYLAAGESPSLLQTLASFFAAASNGPLGLGHALLMGGLWVLFLMVAWGVFRVSRWGFFLCIAAAVANSLFSMVTYGVADAGAGPQESLGLNPVQVGVLLNLVFFVPVLLLLNQKIMAPFFNPRLKWWEQHPRVKALLQIEATLAGEKRRYQSFDISASGMFLGTGVRPELALGEQFPASLHLEGEGIAIEVLCKVVWISDGLGRTPAGCGVTFTYLHREQKRTLHRFIRAKIAQGHLLERT